MGNIESPKGTVLIIDDEPDITNFTSETLREEGYTVVVHNRSVDGLEAFQAEPGKFDVIVLDWNMPEMDGIEVAERVTNIDPKAQILFCSARWDAQAIIAGRLNGLSKNFVAKPFDLDHFVSKVDELAGIKQILKEDEV